MTNGSNALNEIIQAEISAHGGMIPFSRFMALALYQPEHGYYNNANFELGKRGDFTTASEISPLYAQCFANTCAELLPELPQMHLLELGAGSGRFAGDLLTALAKLGSLPDRYFIHEISPRLREKQRLLLQSDYSDLVNRVEWLETLPSTFSGIILANEVLDALPVNCFHVSADGIKERCVGISNGSFTWQLSDTATPELTQIGSQLLTDYQLDVGYESEINLQLTSYIQSLTQMLHTGVMLFSDYGYGQREYYHPERRQGTLTCFYQHRHHADPLVMTGQQDITAHVDFTRVIEAAATEGATLAGYTSQSVFLLDAGLLTLAAEQESTLSPADQFNLHQAIKTLTLPTEMGDLVKIMAIAKNINPRLRGFNLKDRSRDL